MTTLRRLLAQLNPEEVYHLAGQSHVGASFEIPESTCEFTAMGTLRLLEVIRDLPNKPKFLHASSSEIFGRPSLSPQDESTPTNPVTPYGVAKNICNEHGKGFTVSTFLVRCNAICFNHESPRRGESFVTRKISLAVAKIALGLQSELRLGNLDAERDWDTRENTLMRCGECCNGRPQMICPGYGGATHHSTVSGRRIRVIVWLGRSM